MADKLAKDKRRKVFDVPDSAAELRALFNKGVRIAWFLNVYTGVAYGVRLNTDPRIKPENYLWSVIDYEYKCLKLRNNSVSAYEHHFEYIWESLIAAVYSP